MRRLFVSAMAIILTSGGVYAQERTPLQLPLGLTPGISPDSTSAILSSFGASLIPGRELNYRVDFSYAGIPMKQAIPVFLKSTLLSISLYSGRIEDKALHIIRIEKAFKYIEDNFDCRVVKQEFTPDKLSGLPNDYTELATFTSDHFTLFLNSIYKPDGGYILNIQIYALPLQARRSAK